MNMASNPSINIVKIIPVFQKPIFFAQAFTAKYKGIVLNPATNVKMEHQDCAKLRASVLS